MLEIADAYVLLCVPGERNAVAVDLRVALSGRQHALREDRPAPGPDAPRDAPRDTPAIGHRGRPRPPPDAEQRAAPRAPGPGPARQPLALGRFAWIDVTGWLYPLPDEVRRERIVRQWARGRERTNVVVGLLEAIHVQNGFEPPRHFDLSSVYDELDEDMGTGPS